jgi:hypothetical protein
MMERGVVFLSFKESTVSQLKPGILLYTQDALAPQHCKNLHQNDEKAESDLSWKTVGKCQALCLNAVLQGCETAGLCLISNRL